MNHNWWSRINQRRLETLLLNVPQVFVDFLAWKSDLKGERWYRADPMTQAEIEMMGRGWLTTSERGWDLMGKFCYGETTPEELDELRRLCQIERARRWMCRDIAVHCEGFVEHFEKKLPLRRVDPLPVTIDVSELYAKTAADLRSQHGGVYQNHFQGEVVVFSVTRSRLSFDGRGNESWELYLLSGAELSMVRLMEQAFFWDQMDVKGRIEVDCHQDCRMLQIIVAGDRMKDMLTTTRIEILIEKEK